MLEGGADPAKVREILKVDGQGDFDEYSGKIVAKEIQLAWQPDRFNLDDQELLMDPSVSIIVDNGNLSPRDHLYNHLKARKSVSSLNNNRCSHCNSLFTTILRAHHCRLCAKIFCGNCIKYTEISPNQERSYIHPNYWLSIATNIYRNGKEPICFSCETNLSKEILLIIQAFKVINPSFKNLKKAATLCFSWRRGVLEYLSEVRKIQYKIPASPHEIWEKQMLWINRKLWVGHDKWIFQLLKVVDWENVEQANEISLLLSSSPSLPCWETMCSSSCRKSSYTDPETALELLGQAFTHEVPRKYAIQCLLNTTEEQLLCYLPLLVHGLRYEKRNYSPTWDFLSERALVPENARLRMELYWTLNIAAEDTNFKRYYSLFKDLLIAQTTQKLHLEEAKKLLKSVELITAFENLSPNSTKQLSHLTELYLPYRPDLKIIRFLDTYNPEQNKSTVIISECTQTNWKEYDTSSSSTPSQYTQSKSMPSNLSILSFKGTDGNPMSSYHQTVDSPPSLSPLSLSPLSLSPISPRAHLSVHSLSPTPAPPIFTTFSRSPPGGYSSLPSEMTQKHSPVEKFTFKVGDLRKDQFVMNLIKRFNGYLKEAGFPTLPTYHIFPTSSNSGIIQILTTFLEFSEVEQQKWTFFRENGFFLEDEVSVQVRKRFLEACAVFSVVSWLLDTVDWTLEDILLNNAPKYFKDIQSLESLNLGNYTHTEYIERCADIYKVLRKHNHLFLNLLGPLFQIQPKINLKQSEESIRNHFLNRSMPHLSDKEAREQFIKVFSTEPKPNQIQNSTLDRLTNSMVGLLNTMPWPNT
eukprot:TRINITY_DN9961_c0_g3_i1.p1 TRINITY_DN9961_c0_g3~~TRINITY_DN9961_c0_g3_i1.p1  ORF type:complete len:815 (+),score=208.06 TRINITY_DN9961_c0_g3_i1:22-2445(+)